MRLWVADSAYGPVLEDVGWRGLRSLESFGGEIDGIRYTHVFR